MARECLGTPDLSTVIRSI